VYLRGGTRDLPIAVFGTLGSLQADLHGQARLQTESLTATAGGERVVLSTELLADGDHFIEIRAQGTNEVVAASDIPAQRAAPVAVAGAEMSQGLNFIAAASTGQLGSVDTDVSGHLHPQTSDIAMAGTGARVRLSSDLLFDGDHFVDLHDANGTLVATATLPRLEPTGTNALDVAA
jgi:hypothetical protein